ncbi:hypothetical protein FACS189496_4820 [Bacilli bacterium]|nr:hypothetical protein FACS189496_4820 [Bacilli bacterium]
MVKKNLKKQKGVIIVYPSSRTRNLIKEIRNLGYVPIVIPTSKYDKFVLDMFDETCIQQFNSAIKSEEYKKYNPDIVEFDSDQDVNKIIKYTKNKYEILAVIPCSDPSLKISDCLQKEFKPLDNVLTCVPFKLSAGMPAE